MKTFHTFLTEDSLKSHVKMVAAMNAKSKPKGIRTPAELLRDYGKSYPFDASSFLGKRGTPKECYRNAANLVIGSNLTYIEGYVQLLNVPIAHAWCINPKGRVIDPTLDGKFVEGYYGVPIKQTYLTRTMLKTKIFGVLDVMSNPDILTDDPKNIVAS